VAPPLLEACGAGAAGAGSARVGAAGAGSGSGSCGAFSSGEAWGSGWLGAWAARLRRAALGGVADDGQLAAYLDGVVLLGDDLGQHTGGRGGDFGIDLVGRHLDERLVEFDRVAFLLEPARDRSLGDAFTECRHLDGEGHVF